MCNSPTSINSLAGGDILQQVLLHASGDILRSRHGMDGYRQAVAMAGVCRKWMEHLKQLLCQTAIIERRQTILDATNTEQPAVYEVSSNIPFILRLGQSAATRKLVIVGIFSDGVFRLAGILRQLRFCSGTWTKVQTLMFKSYMTNASHLSADRSVRYTGDYLLQNLPNIIEVEDRESTAGGVQRHLVNELISARLPKLRSLQVYQPQIDLGASGCVPKNVTRLMLSAPVVLLHRMHLPHIMAAHLRYLSIYLIDSAFPWAYFANSNEDNIEFTCLEELRLAFVENEILPATVGGLGANLAFPKLRKLVVQGALATYTDFYSLFAGSSVRSLIINEPARHWAMLDAGIFRNLTTLDLKLTLGTAVLSDVEPSILAKLAVASPMLQVAKIHIPSLCLLPEQQINWPFLRQLHIFATSADLNAIWKLISQLPRLWHLQVSCFKTEYPADMLPTETAPHALRSKLQVLELNSAAPINDQGGVWLWRLARIIPSLVKVHFRIKPLV